jgi:hypothetical protein
VAAPGLCNIAAEYRLVHIIESELDHEGTALCSTRLFVILVRLSSEAQMQLLCVVRIKFLAEILL